MLTACISRPRLTQTAVVGGGYQTRGGLLVEHKGFGLSKKKNINNATCKVPDELLYISKIVRKKHTWDPRLSSFALLVSTALATCASIFPKKGQEQEEHKEKSQTRNTCGATWPAAKFHATRRAVEMLNRLSDEKRKQRTGGEK